MMALGAVSPEVDGRMRGAMDALSALSEQIANDIILLGRQGASTAVMDRLHSRADAFESGLVALQAQWVTIKDDMAAEAWFAGAESLKGTGVDLLNAASSARGSAIERQRFMGLGWGLGTAVAAAGLAWWVWRKRGGKRRRRR